MIKRELFPTLFLLTCLSFASCSNNKSSSESFSNSSFLDDQYLNPVWEPVCPDPSIVRGDNGKYYVYCTEETADWGEQGYSKLVVPILESSNLVDWECIGSAFTLANMPLWNNPADQIWAPDVVKVGNQYVMSYSLTHWTSKHDAIGIATSDNPIGPWTDRGQLISTEDIGGVNPIDSCIFVDDDNRVYLFWGSFAGIYGIEMSEDGLSIKPGAERVLLCGGLSQTSTTSKDYEGSFVRKINGEYIIFLSTGTCCNGFNSTYKVVSAKSSSPLGPYYDKEGRNML